MPARSVFAAAVAGLASLGLGFAAPVDRGDTSHAQWSEEMPIRRRIGAPVIPHAAGFGLADMAPAAKEFAAKRAADRGATRGARAAGAPPQPQAPTAPVQPFDIVVIFENQPPTAGARKAFEDAEAVWETLLPGVATPGHPGTVTITAKFAEMDQGGDPDTNFNIFGSAATDTFFNAPGSFTTATTGHMTFDTYDLGMLESDGTLGDVILHEMGHVLGLGKNGWSRNNLKTGFKYTGANGLGAFRREVGPVAAAYVPIEADGGVGTKGGHWDEQHGDGTGAGGSFGRAPENELMTGTIDTPVYMAAFTPFALEDQGFVSGACLSSDDCANPDRGGPSCNVYPGCTSQEDCWLPNVCGPKEVGCLGDGALCTDPSYWSPHLPNKGADGLPLFLSASICDRYYGSQGLYCKQDLAAGKDDRCCREMCGQC